MPAVRPEAGATRGALRKKADGPSDPCPICEVRVGRQSDLKRHIDTHDSYEDKKHKCPHCNYRTSILCAFNAHVGKHDGVRYTCPAEGCELQFTDKAARSRHLTRVHKSQNVDGKRRRTSQLSGTVRKTRAPATVRREVGTEVNETYSQFSKFASGSRPRSVAAAVDSLSDLSELSDLTDSDEESSPVPSTPTSLHASPLVDMTSAQSDLAVYYMCNDQQYISPELFGELKLASASFEQDIFKSQWRGVPNQQEPFDFLAVQHTSLAVTAHQASFFQEPSLPLSLQDFSYDINSDADFLYGTSQSLDISLPCFPIVKDEYASTDDCLSKLMADAAYKPIHSQTNGNYLVASPVSSVNDYDAILYADPMDSTKSWTQALDEPIGLFEPLHFQASQWSMFAVQGHLF